MKIKQLSSADSKHSGTVLTVVDMTDVSTVAPPQARVLQLAPAPVARALAWLAHSLRARLALSDAPDAADIVDASDDARTPASADDDDDVSSTTDGACASAFQQMEALLQSRLEADAAMQRSSASHADHGRRREVRHHADNRRVPRPVYASAAIAPVYAVAQMQPGMARRRAVWRAVIWTLAAIAVTVALAGSWLLIHAGETDSPEPEAGCSTKSDCAH